MREIQEPACHNDSSKPVTVDVADLPLSVFLKSVISVYKYILGVLREYIDIVFISFRERQSLRE